MSEEAAKVRRASRVIGVGASAGGVEALTRMVAGLPRDLPAAVVIVLHVMTRSASVLPDILNRAGPLSASHARDGDPLTMGRILVAPPDRHLVLGERGVRLVEGPRENGVRPAIDPLFRSGARAFGRRFVGVVLSGTLDDGSQGLLAVRRAGGTLVVQDPDDALYPDMPRHALELAGADACVGADDLGELLDKLVRRTQAERRMKKDQSGPRHTPAEGATPGRPVGEPSPFTCPDCGGVLWESGTDGALLYECRTGHVLSPATLEAGQQEAVEEALWAAIRTLEEAAAIAHRLERRARDRGADQSADRFGEQAREHEHRVQALRGIVHVPPTALPTPGSERPGVRARRPTGGRRPRGRPVRG